jgi:hypothetical protein
MRPRWTLTVEGLGRIERAKVDLRPLMLFVGENNSGKSYLASLLWGLFSMHGNFELPEGPLLRECDEWLRTKLPGAVDVEEHTLTEDDFQLLSRLFDSVLDSSKTRLVSDIFASSFTSAPSIKFQKFGWPSGVGVQRVNPPPDNPILSTTQNGESIISTDLHGEAGRRMFLWLTMLHFVFGKFLRYPSDGSFHEGDTLFLPASRTGFMLLYKAAARRSFQQAFRGAKRANQQDSEWFDLTRPAFHFLDMMAFGLKPKQGRYAAEADFLEQGLGGRVELVTGTGATNEYRYQPAGEQKPLSMALSSSLVTELTPIILALRHLPDIPILILEEPEAHLHPKLQRRLAQVIVRLIRKGLYVWITTHSENFCQQINNFIKIGTSTRRAQAQEELGYGEHDYLELDDVAGYQFEIQGERSVVTGLKETESGLVMPTFNREILALSKEIDFLDRLTGEHE